ncbi:MAG: transketolase C-terminal domain-containing protein [Candidatus Woesearchaeota archaeon]
MGKFPISIKDYKSLKFNLSQKKLSKVQKEQLLTNINLCRDIIVFFTGYASAKGVSGHTGGAYDIVPEALIFEAFMRGDKNIYPVLFDEAGHRVALQYLLAALDPKKGMQLEDLLHYREYNSGLPGHPEVNPKLGVDFASGRLGHMWGDVNGVAERTKQKVVMFGSDGSQQEGNDAEAARQAVAAKLPVVLLIDDNNVTIEGHPHDYLSGFDIVKTLEGHGLKVKVVKTGEKKENLNLLYQIIRELLLDKSGPVALVHRREMAHGIPKVEGECKGHDAVSAEIAIEYLKEKGYGYKKKYDQAINVIESAMKVQDPVRLEDQKAYRGSSKEVGSCRRMFGTALVEIMKKQGKEGRKKVMVYSADLGGSTGVNAVLKKFPDRYVKGGIMERGLFLRAAGFGSKERYQGIFATFSVFGSEMLPSEIQMSALNQRNVLCHFSHAGVDWMADDTCHYGVNISFIDCHLPEESPIKMYFPADALQMEAIVKKVYDNGGLRFIFSTRSDVPYVLNNKGKKFFGKGYKFIPGKDELIREGKDGYIVTYGEMLYRCLDAVEQLREQGINVGLVNKSTLNSIDEQMLKKVGKSKLVVFVESQNKKSGFGNGYAKALLEQGLNPKFLHLASVRTGNGGIWEHIPHQELDPKSIVMKIEKILKN